MTQNVIHKTKCTQRKTETRPHATCTQHLAKFQQWFLDMRADRQTDRQADRQKSTCWS